MADVRVLDAPVHDQVLPPPQGFEVVFQSPLVPEHLQQVGLVRSGCFGVLLDRILPPVCDQ